MSAAGVTVTALLAVAALAAAFKYVFVRALSLPPLFTFNGIVFSELFVATCNVPHSENLMRQTQSVVHKMRCSGGHMESAVLCPRYVHGCVSKPRAAPANGLVLFFSRTF